MHAVAPARPTATHLTNACGRQAPSQAHFPAGLALELQPDVAWQFGRPARVVLDQAQRMNSLLSCWDPSNSAFPTP